VIVDLFRGPGGWSEGLRPLGLADIGLEWDIAACHTWDADAVACWNTALNIAEHRLRTQVTTVLPPGRVLSVSEYGAAWHAIEGAAGEEGADPATA
jgi:hypothetical protein